MKDFFDLRLQAFLECRFHVRAEIVDHPPESDAPTIVHAFLFGSGSIYGDATSDYAVQFHHGPFPLKLEYAIHHDSNQIDYWKVRAEGVPKDAVEELTALCDPWQYDCYHCNAHLKPSIVIQSI